MKYVAIFQICSKYVVNAKKLTIYYIYVVLHKICSMLWTLG